MRPSLEKRTVFWWMERWIRALDVEGSEMVRENLWEAFLSVEERMRFALGVSVDARRRVMPVLVVAVEAEVAAGVAEVEVEVEDVVVVVERLEMVVLEAKLVIVEVLAWLWGRAKGEVGVRGVEGRGWVNSEKWEEKSDRGERGESGERGDEGVRGDLGDAGDMHCIGESARLKKEVWVGSVWVCGSKGAEVGARGSWVPPGTMISERWMRFRIRRADMYSNASLSCGGKHCESSSDGPAWMGDDMQDFKMAIFAHQSSSGTASVSATKEPRRPR